MPVNDPDCIPVQRAIWLRERGHSWREVGRRRLGCRGWPRAAVSRIFRSTSCHAISRKVRRTMKLPFVTRTTYETSEAVLTDVRAQNRELRSALHNANIALVEHRRLIVQLRDPKTSEATLAKIIRGETKCQT